MDEPERLEVLDELGRCAQLCGELAEAGRVWEELVAGLGGADPPRLADVKRRLATIYELEGASPRAAAVRMEAAEVFVTCGRDAEAAPPMLRDEDGAYGAEPEEEPLYDE